MDGENEYEFLPPRREKHGSKKDLDDPPFIEPLSEKKERKTKPQSFNSRQKELNSRLERRKALKEFTLNPQAYMQKASGVKEKKAPEPKEKKIRKKWSGGLITANIILCLFLLMMGSLFFLIFYHS